MSLPLVLWVEVFLKRALLAWGVEVSEMCKCMREPWMLKLFIDATSKQIWLEKPSILSSHLQALTVDRSLTPWMKVSCFPALSRLRVWIEMFVVFEGWRRLRASTIVFEHANPWVVTWIWEAAPNVEERMAVDVWKGTGTCSYSSSLTPFASVGRARSAWPTVWLEEQRWNATTSLHLFYEDKVA